MGIFTMSEWSIVSSRRTEIPGSGPIFGEYLCILYHIYQNKHQGSHISIAGVPLGCGICLLLFNPALLPQLGSDGWACSPHTAHRPAVCGWCFSCWAALQKQTLFSCLPKYAVALSTDTTMWSSALNGMMSVPTIPGAVAPRATYGQRVFL